MAYHASAVTFQTYQGRYVGFVVDAGKRLVTVDHSHNHFCVTTPEGNPVELMLTPTLKVTSIFARTKGKRDRSDPGDNSPMLYVIKGLHELKTTKRVKLTAKKVLEGLDVLRISSRDKTRARSDIKRFIKNHGENAFFQIKSVNVDLRKHINPLAWGNVPLGTTPPRNILLIDDMVTSGTSLVNAEAILKHRYPTARIEALTLFGSSK